jgi:hypothetical protein
MKLYEAFQDTGFHTTIMTTFCVEFDAFESIVLNRLTSKRRGLSERHACATPIIALAGGVRKRPVQTIC